MTENVAVPIDATPTQVEEALRRGLEAGGHLPPAARLAKERNIDVLVERFKRIAFRKLLDERIAEMRVEPFAAAYTSVGKFPYPVPPVNDIIASMDRVRREVGLQSGGKA